MGSRAYEVLWLADWFHSYPHVTLTLQHVNSTFSPESDQYREVLYFWACVPVLLLVLTLLGLIVFFGYRCCCAGGKDHKLKHAEGYRWSVAVFAVLTCGVIGMSFYGNEETQKGTKTFVSSIEDINSTVVLIKTEIHSLRTNVNNTMSDITELEIYYNRYKNKFNKTVRSDLWSFSEEARTLAKGILNDISGIDEQSDKVDLSHVAMYTQEIGFYRWIATIAVLCWILLMCLLLLCGVGCGSKCILMLCAGLIVITLVIGMATTGLYLGTAVGLGDFCVAPAGFLRRIAKQNDKDGVIKSEYLDYYLQCKREIKNPFNNDLKDAYDSVTTANHTLSKALSLVNQSVKRAKDDADMDVELSEWQIKTSGHLSEAQNSVQQLMILADCSRLHTSYIQASRAVCYTAHPGVAFLLLGLAISSLLFVLLIYLTAFAWRYFGKRPGYVEVDEDDPFLPRNEHTAPSYYRYGSEGSLTGGPVRPSAPMSQQTSYNRYSGTANESVPMHRRSSPPPAYNTNEFYRHYNEMSSGVEDSPSMDHSQT